MIELSSVQTTCIILYASSDPPLQHTLPVATPDIAFYTSAVQQYTLYDAAAAFSKAWLSVTK